MKKEIDLSKEFEDGVGKTLVQVWIDHDIKMKLREMNLDVETILKSAIIKKKPFWLKWTKLHHHGPNKNKWGWVAYESPIMGYQYKVEGVNIEANSNVPED